MLDLWDERIDEAVRELHEAGSPLTSANVADYLYDTTEGTTDDYWCQLDQLVRERFNLASDADKISDPR
jgi:hypothetical protein